MANYTFKLALTIILVWLTVVAGKMGYANLNYFSAKNQIDSWVDTGAISSESSYRQALQDINLSNEMHPANPQYIETLANIQEWAVYGEFADEMWHALVMLGETGPYTKHANLTIVDAGLMMITNDSPLAEQAAVLAAEHYRRAMANSQAVKALKAIVGRYEAEDIVAGW